MKPQTIAESEYTLIQSTEHQALLWIDNKLEVFAVRDTPPASWHLKHGKKFLEFVRTASREDSAILESEYTTTDPVKACQKALRITTGITENERMEVINLILGTHGVEAIRGDWQNGYWMDIVATYCNTGDSYVVTVIRQRGETQYSQSRFSVGTVGGFVERNEKHLGII